MSSVKSPQEIRAAKIESMGEELGVLHFELWNELAKLHAVWSDCRNLFIESEEHVTLMNRTAPVFFSNVQHLFINEVLLHLCRITDPTHSNGKPNQTIRRFPALIEDIQFRNEVSALVDEAVSSTEFARDHRNRRIAHRDLATARKVHPRPLEAATIQNISRAMMTIDICMNTVEYQFQQSRVMYEIADSPGDARSVLRWLKRGVEQFENQFAEMKRQANDLGAQEA